MNHAKRPGSKKGIGSASEHGYFFLKIALSEAIHHLLRGTDVALRDDIKALTPRLRRYARALATGGTAPSPLADDLVQATLVRALGARQIGSSADLAVRLFATVTQLHRDIALTGRQAQTAGAGRPALVTSQPSLSEAPQGQARQTRLSAGLLSLPLEEREAMLLVALEGFDHGEAARILRISRASLISRLTHARTALETYLHATPSIPPRGRGVPYLRVVQ
jgi:RNA polymerase sigma-70 factor (ECF subfamily)